MPHLFSGDIECKVSPKRMWFGAFRDAHNCLPKALPEKVAGIEYLEGKIAESGCVRTIKFFTGLTADKEKLYHEVKEVKEKLEEVDEKLFKVKAVVLGGGFLGTFFKRYKYAFEFKEGAHPDSCHVHWSIEYEALIEQLLHCPDEIKKDFTTTFKGVEAYLLSHYDYC